MEPREPAAREEVKQIDDSAPCIVSEETDVASHIVSTAEGNKMHPIRFAYMTRVNTEVVLNHMERGANRVCA